MTTERKQRFACAIMALGAAFSKEIGPALLEAYGMALEDFAIRDIELACKEAICTSEFFPRPAQLRKMAGEPDAIQEANDAWGETLRLAQNSRAARHPDETAERVVRRLGGWLSFGQKTRDQLDWLRRDFLVLYRAEANLERREQSRLKSTLESAQMLMGTCEEKPHRH